jgi:hypothetical protein
MVRFYLQNLNDVEAKEQYHVKISNRFAALEIFNSDDGGGGGGYDDDDINRVWERIRENIKLQPQRIYISVS